MANSSARSLEEDLTAPFCLGQILVRKIPIGRFVLSHRDDETLDTLKSFRSAEDAIDIAKYDDAGNYRPLKTSPDLRHGWRLELDSVEELRRALDYFYPGRLAVFAAWKSNKLETTSLRQTWDRQGAIASTKLPREKFDPACDQTAASNLPGSAPPATVPLLCQEACNLLVAECRKIVKAE